MRGVFDCLIIDEAHEYRSADSLQAAAALTLAAAIPRAICLTGTLLGGYASHLYNILLIVSPAFRERYSPRDGGRSRFARELGLRSRRRRLHDDRTSYRPRPGVSPAVAPWLLEKGVYLRLDEVVQLPPLQEEALLVEPSPDLRRAILQLHRRAREQLENSSAARATAAIMHSLLSFPDLAWAGEEVMDPISGQLLLRAAPLGEGPLPKEEALISLVREEIARGRPCLVYVTYTGARDIAARLVSLLREAGIVAEALRAEAVPPARREAWLLSRMAAGIQALVCQPRLVALGLDLVHFPTVVFFQPDPDPFVVRQAARRSYRIGQSRPVRVVYMAYRESAQELLLSLLAKKAAASLLLEGEALGSGLLHLSEEETLRELARLVREGGAEDAREALRAAAEADAWASSRPGWEGIAPSPATVLSSMGLQLALPGL
jgi:SNF2 family DNA or RNA helicase